MPIPGERAGRGEGLEMGPGWMVRGSLGGGGGGGFSQLYSSVPEFHRLSVTFILVQHILPRKTVLQCLRDVSHVTRIPTTMVRTP